MMEHIIDQLKKEIEKEQKSYLQATSMKLQKALADKNWKEALVLLEKLEELLIL